MGNYECSRSPDCLRPLAMKNSDIQIIASATNRILNSVASDTEEEQQGFVNGRQLLSNIVKVDTTARITSINSEASSMMPCFASMDIAAAFPSLTHARMWATLRRWGIHGVFQSPAVLLQHATCLPRPKWYSSTATSSRIW
eukprot:4225821-Pyramimonas_sp.AAC.1